MNRWRQDPRRVDPLYAATDDEVRRQSPDDDGFLSLVERFLRCLRGQRP